MSDSHPLDTTDASAPTRSTEATDASAPTQPPATTDPSALSQPPETSVVDGGAAAVCPYCDRPFVTERQRALHVGERHDPTADERRAYDAAREDESDELFRLHLKVIFAVGLLYAGSVVTSVVAFSVAG